MASFQLQLCHLRIGIVTYGVIDDEFAVDPQSLHGTHEADLVDA